MVSWGVRGLGGSVSKERLVAQPTRWGWEVPRAPLLLCKIAAVGFSYHPASGLKQSNLRRAFAASLLFAYWLQTAVFQRGRGVSSQAEPR